MGDGGEGGLRVILIKRKKTLPPIHEERLHKKTRIYISKSGFFHSGAGLLDCIGWVRRLQNRDPPIAIFFEDVIEDAMCMVLKRKSPTGASWVIAERFAVIR